MDKIAIVFLCIFISFAIFYLWLTFAFVSKVNQSKKIQHKRISIDKMPPAAIILCLRGADPFLLKCLEALLNQNYPYYQLQIVIDSHQDPAWELVAQIMKRQAAKHVKVSTLVVPRVTCSLKCSALLQAISGLDNNIKVVALVDADTIVHPNWLRELVTPLANPKVGATTGNRWYLPQGRYWGSAVRYIWNIAAVLQMYYYQIPWGGSLAIKTEVFRQTKLLNRWEQAFTEDVIVQRILRQQGLKVEFVPSIVMVNREECELKSFQRWVKRQLLCARLYHTSWNVIVIHGILTLVLPIVAIMLSLVAWLNGELTTVAYLGGGLAIYVVIQILCIVILEDRVRSIVKRKGEILPSINVNTIFKVLAALPITQMVYGLALTLAIFMRQVEWRGITYQIKGPWDIKLVKYQPYTYSDKPIDSMASL